MQKKAKSQLANPQSNQKSGDERRVYQYDVDQDGGQSQCVIWGVQSERVHSQQTLVEAQITAVCQELTVAVGESFPDGKNNQVFPKALFAYNSSSSNSYSNMGANDSMNWGQERKYGRGAGGGNYQPFRQSVSGVTVSRPGIGRGGQL